MTWTTTMVRVRALATSNGSRGPGRATRLALAIALTGSACRSEASTGAARAAASTSPPSTNDSLARAEAAAKRLGGTLRSKLEEAMTQGGAARAIEVCASEAQAVAAKVRADTGVTVGRASRRLRNPVDGGPPWVGEWLLAQGARKAAEAKGVREIVDTPLGATARVLKPIEVEAKCLACHGAPEAIAPDVKAMIAARYPADTATGYAAGDLRGALWAEAPASR